MLSNNKNMITVTFSVLDKEVLITKYTLDIQENSIEKTHEDASSVWDEFTVLAEWGNGFTKSITPGTYSDKLESDLTL